MPYGPTHKKKIICLMGLLNRNMPYGPTYKRKLYALWAYSIEICLMGLPNKICLMGLFTNNKYFVVP